MNKEGAAAEEEELDQETEQEEEDEPQAEEEEESAAAEPLPAKARHQKPEQPAVVQIRLSKKRLVVTVVVLVVAAAALTCWKLGVYGKLHDRYEAASITLKVKEGDQYELAGAVVAIKGASYTSDDHGKITLPKLPAGSYDLTASKAGYTDLHISLSLHRGDNDLRILSLTKLPEKLYSVKGLVQDYVSGKPITNVMVTLGSKTIQTSPSGEYSFDQQVPGALKLVLSKDGYLSKEMPLKLESADIISTKIPMVPAGQVVFVSNRDGKRGLYAASLDGASQQPFAGGDKDGEDFGQVLSPDNKRIAFSSTRDHVKDSYGSDLSKLYVANVDGTGLSKVSDDVTSRFIPVWSADGRRLFFTGYSSSKLDKTTYKVYDVQKNTVSDIGEPANGVVFSPDSSTIAYYAVVSQTTPATDTAPATTANVSQLKTWNLDSGQRTSLVSRSNQYMSDLSFSADGKAVSYEVVLDSVRHRFSALIAQPGSESEIPVLQFNKRRYVASPDGASKAFVEERDGKADLFVVDKNEQNEKRMTTLGVMDATTPPQWDASGRYLIAGVKREGENALYIVSLDGGDPKKITDFFVESLGQ